MSRGLDFLERLKAECLVGCAARDDRLLAAGSGTGPGPELLNLSRPDLVRSVHADFADAGAALIATNTAGANAFRLRRHGLEARAREINLAGARLAVAAAGRSACVAGAVGPLALSLDEDWDLGALVAAYREQVSALLEGGVHALHLESFANLEELLLAVEQARALGGREVPILATMLFGDGLLVESGEDAARVAAALLEAGADALGVQGGRSMSAAVRAAEKLVAAAGPAPVAAYPNAGFPEAAEGRLVYMASPAYMADTALKLARAGVRLVGPGCGATPDMVRAMGLALSTIRARAAPGPAGAAAALAAAAAGAAGPAFKPGGFLSGLGPGLPIIAEIDPPGHLQVAPVIEDIRAVAAAGADAISLAENPLASLKMGNVAVAAIVRREIGVQTICHVTCRDRNALGLQSALMGAHALGIQAILAITGDPLAPGSGTGRSVFDLNSFTLVRLLAGLNRGVSHTGASLKGETDFSIGVAFNSAARNLEGEVQRLRRKVGEGARFVMTQPVFDDEHARRVLDLTRGCGARIFLGFFPLISARAALYLHNEVPGMHIPEAALKRLTDLPAKEDQEKAGLDMARELLTRLADSLEGVYLISPHNRARVLAPLVRMLRDRAPAAGA